MFLQQNQNQYLIRFAILIFTTCYFSFVNGQNGVAINTTGASANNSAILDLSNTVNKGLLLPQVSSTSLIASPATGLVAYQTGAPAGFYYYNGTTWVLLGSSSGNGNYIFNQTSVQSGANFNIGGAGVIGTTLNVSGLSTLNGITNTGVLSSSGGAINLNTNGTDITNINTATNTGTVNIGNTSNGGQTINVGAGFTGGTNAVNIGTNADGLTGVNIYAGGSGVNINNVSSNRITTIGGAAGNLTINVGTTALGGTVGLGSSGTTTNVNGNIANINAGISKTTNINTGAAGNTGTVNIGGVNSSTSNQTINIGGNGLETINVGTGATGASVVSVGAGSGDAGSSTTNIKSGSGGVNINANINQPTNINTGTSSKDVTIGNSANNLFLPKFNAAGTILYSSATTGQIAATAAGTAGQVLTSNGTGAPMWTNLSAGTLGQGIVQASTQTNTQFFGNNTGTYNPNSTRGWTIGTWQDVAGLSVSKVIATGHLPLISFSIDGYSNGYLYYEPAVTVFRVVRDVSTSLGKASVLTNEATYNFYYFNANLIIYDNTFTPDGTTSHTWKVQYWMSNDYGGNTESIFLEDRNVKVQEITP